MAIGTVDEASHDHDLKAEHQKVGMLDILRMPARINS